MIRSMTGFGRYFSEDALCSQVWEIRSVNGKYLDIRWRLPGEARPFEAALEKLVKSHASRGRLEISLSLTMLGAGADSCTFRDRQASAMLDAIENLAVSRGEKFTPDHSRLLSIASLWQAEQTEPDDNLQASLEEGLLGALEDWNESRGTEARALSRDLLSRFASVEEWVEEIAHRAPDIKAERFETVRERLADLLERAGQDLEEGRFLQEIALMADRLDVSEELTRLSAHMSRLREILSVGADAGRKLDFTLQECFREVNTCGNKIQDLHISRLIVDLKNELEKCREQVQNLE